MRTLLLSFLFAGCLVPVTRLRAQTIKVMTYNIHHANPPSKAKDSTIDLQAVADVIKAAHPDLVALQEIDVYNGRAGVNLDEAKELGRLTGMNYYFTRAIFYRGGAYGDAVLSRLPVKDTMRYELPITAGAKAETRSLCVIKVQLPGGKQILFGSTHLDQYRDESNRLLQASTMAGIIRSFTLPFILGGDLNAFPDSRTLGIMDSVLTRSCTSGCPLTIPTENPNRTIDYILYTPAASFETLDIKAIHETYASDHLPVITTLRLR
jgi:endonuclease/exonuclease/phosphatase family metal-dependent hydrolase